MPEDTGGRRAIIRAALMTPSPLARYQPAETRRATVGDVVFADGPRGRHAVVLGPVAPERLFGLARAFFGDAAGFSCELELDTAGAVDEALRARGWRLDEEEPALVLVPTPRIFPPWPPGLTIRRVVDEEGLVRFHALSPLGARWVPTLSAATDPAVALFVGYADGEPVATSRLVCFGPTADLTSVGTAPAYRRRGYGTAVTWAAVAEGVRRGCTAAMLSATPMGYRVYARMGFVPACTFRTYVPPDDLRDP